MRKSYKSKDEISIILDFNNQVWRCHHATERVMQPNTDGINVGSVMGLMKVIIHGFKQSREINPTLLPKLVIIEDRAPIRKRKLYDEYRDAFKDHPDPSSILYKGNRKSKGLEYNPVDICKEFMSCIPHESCYCDEEEADDVVASVVQKIGPYSPAILYSSDRDLWQLLDGFPNLQIFLDNKGSKPTKEYMMKKYRTDDFRKICLHKIITGDSGDNVKGVRNFPFKKTIEAFHKCDGSIESYLYWIVKLCGDHGRETLQLFQENNIRLLQLNQQLITLRKDLDYVTEKVVKPDMDKWWVLCENYEIPSMMNLNLMNIF